MTQLSDEADKAQNFSLATAMASGEAMFEALPKTKRAEFIGEFNEVMVVLSTISGFFTAGCDEAEKTRRRSVSVTTLLGEYLDRIAPDVAASPSE